MAQESSQTPNEDQDKSTRHAYLDHEEIVRLFALLLMRTVPQRSETNICLKNPNLFCATSSGCSLTRIQLCLIPPVAVEVRCERLSQSVLSIVLDSRSTPNLRTSLAKPSNDPET